MLKDKRGLTSFIFGFIGLFILMLVLVSFMAVQEGGISPDNMSTVLDSIVVNISENLVLNESNSPIINVAFSFTHFITYSAVEVTKMAIHYGVANPEYVNPKMLLYIIMISLCAPIVYVLIKLLILIFLFIKEGIQSHRARKKFKELKDER